MDRDVSEDPGAEAQPPPRRPRHGRGPRRKRGWIIAGGAVLVALAVLAAALWLNRPDANTPSTVTVQGVEYVTNVEVEEQDGYLFVYLPVNADTADVVLETPNAADTRQIREFLDGLDTLVPGEYVVSLSAANLHFIVDGIDETE